METAVTSPSTTRGQRCCFAFAMDLIVLVLLVVTFLIFTQGLTLLRDIHLAAFVSFPIAIGNDFRLFGINVRQHWGGLFSQIGVFISAHLAISIVFIVFLSIGILRIIYLYSKNFVVNIFWPLILNLFELVLGLVRTLGKTEPNMSFNELLLILVPMIVIDIVLLVVLALTALGQMLGRFFSSSSVFQDYGRIFLMYRGFVIIVTLIVVISIVKTLMKINSFIHFTRVFELFYRKVMVDFCFTLVLKNIWRMLQFKFMDVHKCILLYYAVLIAVLYNFHLGWSATVLVVVVAALFFVYKYQKMSIYNQGIHVTDLKKHVNNEQRKGHIYVDDVTRLNETEVNRVFYPRNQRDIEWIVSLAKKSGNKIICRGQSHTMGAHSIVSDGFVIDMKYMNNVLTDIHEQGDLNYVRIQAGATWETLISYLNPFGLSPKILQSYCSFSIGGTISVNAHGITSNHAMYRSVLEMTVIDCEGRVRIVTKDNENSKLFSLAIGGFGLFGIIVDVTLLVSPNHKLNMETFQLNHSEFHKIYQKYLLDENVEIKIARINIVDFNDIFLYVFKKNEEIFPSRTVSDLSDYARAVSKASQLLYKWIVPTKWFQTLRFYLEAMKRQPLDWTGENDRNQLLFESAKPLAKIYQPLIKMDHTFILQEYFVPSENFLEYMNELAEILHFSLLRKKDKSLTLLNITIRFVREDQGTVLKYAPTDSYAFVLYYRLKRSVEVDSKLQEIHNELVKLTLRLNGTFYLCYRHHYDSDQLRRSYPMINDFFALKNEFDPIGLFSNCWYEKYSKFDGKTEREEMIEEKENSNDDDDELDMKENDGLLELFDEEEKYSELRVIEITHRNDSFSKVMSTPKLRKNFEDFLRNVFNVEDPKYLFFIILKEYQKNENITDLEMFSNLRQSLLDRRFSAYWTVKNFINSFKQSRLERTEFTSEMMDIFKCLGMPTIQNLCVMGDCGKLIKSLQKSGVDILGKVFIVNYEERFTDIIERSSFSDLGEFIKMGDYDTIRARIKDDSISLVTLNPGFHHTEQDDLLMMMRLIYSKLKPGVVCPRFIFTTSSQCTVNAKLNDSIIADSLDLLDFFHFVCQSFLVLF